MYKVEYERWADALHKNETVPSELRLGAYEIQYRKHNWSGAHMFYVSGPNIDECPEFCHSDIREALLELTMYLDTSGIMWGFAKPISSPPSDPHASFYHTKTITTGFGEMEVPAKRHDANLSLEDQAMISEINRDVRDRCLEFETRTKPLVHKVSEDKYISNNYTLRMILNPSSRTYKVILYGPTGEVFIEESTAMMGCVISIATQLINHYEYGREDDVDEWDLSWMG